MGSSTVPRATRTGAFQRRRTIGEDLIDEYRLVIHPVVIGNGTGLFGPLREPLRLDLVEARTFSSGTVIHVYQPHEGTR